MLLNNIIDAIGNTPLVKLRMRENSTAHVYAKLELLNPFGMKDRVAKHIILEAKKSGELADHAPIIESSSGTMALGLALVGTYYNHDVHIVTDPRIDKITYRKLKSLGCQIHIVEKMTKNGWQSARLEYLSQLLERFPEAFWPRQYENSNNPLSYKFLSDELLSEVNHIDMLVGSIGSGGSLCGTARMLKKSNPKLHVVAVDTVGSVIFGQPDTPGRLQSGLGNSLIPLNVDHSVVDEVHWLNDHEAFSATLELAREEKIFAGNSSGSVYAVARWLSTQAPKDFNIAAIFPDRGDRYFDTVYNEDYRMEKEIGGPCILESPEKITLEQVAKSWSYALLNGVKSYEKETSVH